MRIMAMAAVASHYPGFTKWVFACAHPAAAGAQQIKPAKYTAQFCTAQEYALVERLTEMIIPSDDGPGAREAGVAEFVDFMVAHDRARQYKFRTGMTWLNVHAQRLKGRAFLELSEAQQADILEPLAYKSRHREGEEEGRDFFSSIKELTAMGFYSSEIGYRDLDNPALKFYAESPACPHAGDPEHRHLPPPKW
ncbi:MAG: gluconate 2-dehydrogenase subunit 3 family protein [Acidobacteriia bacterium]|nr:gluconate 2-dehydrogenase subunit 3 family protein [Terriglobia bacterium]